MPKKWEEMTLEEKVEDLRKEIKLIYQHLNILNQDIAAAGSEFKAITNHLAEVAKAVEQLERKP